MVVHLAEKFLSFYGNRRFITVSIRGRHCVQSWARLIQSSPSHLTSIWEIRHTKVQRTVNGGNWSSETNKKSGTAPQQNVRAPQSNKKHLNSWWSNKKTVTAWIPWFCFHSCSATPKDSVTVSCINVTRYDNQLDPVDKDTGLNIFTNFSECCNLQRTSSDF